MPDEYVVTLTFPSRANAEEAVRRLEERGFVSPHVSRLSPLGNPRGGLVYLTSAGGETFAFLSDLGCERIWGNPDSALS